MKIKNFNAQNEIDRLLQNDHFKTCLTKISNFIQFKTDQRLADQMPRKLSKTNKAKIKDLLLDLKGTIDQFSPIWDLVLSHNMAIFQIVRKHQNGLIKLYVMQRNDKTDRGSYVGSKWEKFNDQNFQDVETIREYLKLMIDQIGNIKRIAEKIDRVLLEYGEIIKADRKNKNDRNKRSRSQKLQTDQILADQINKPIFDQFKKKLLKGNDRIFYKNCFVIRETEEDRKRSRSEKQVITAFNRNRSFLDAVSGKPTTKKEIIQFSDKIVIHHNNDQVVKLHYPYIEDLEVFEARQFKPQFINDINDQRIEEQQKDKTPLTAYQVSRLEEKQRQADRDKAKREKRFFLDEKEITKWDIFYSGKNKDLMVALNMGKRRNAKNYNLADTVESKKALNDRLLLEAKEKKQPTTKIKKSGKIDHNDNITLSK